MGYFDYSREPRSDIAFIDMKSFYASVECVERGLHPLKTSLCVMSRADNSAGLITCFFFSAVETSFFSSTVRFSSKGLSLLLSSFLDAFIVSSKLRFSF